VRVANSELVEFFYFRYEIVQSNPSTNLGILSRFIFIVNLTSFKASFISITSCNVEDRKDFNLVKLERVTLKPTARLYKEYVIFR
jgi:hypothetical protein